MTAVVVLALRVTVVLAAALAATACMNRAAAATRHAIWTVAVAGALLLPLAAALLPAWRVLPEVRTGAADGGSWSAVIIPVARVPAEPRAFGIQRSVERENRFSAGRAIPLLWLGVSLVLLTRIAADAAAIRRIIRHARPAPRWRALLDEIGGRDPAALRIRVLVSPDVAMPMAWGGSKPVVLLPTDACHWPDERARAVLLHELAHVLRRDCQTHTLARVLAAIHWGNPFAWIALNAMTRERERACDDFVLEQGTAPAEYARHLLDVARDGALGRASAIAPAMARRSELEGRLLSILLPHARRPARAVRAIAAALTAALTLAAATSAPASPAPHAHAARLSPSGAYAAWEWSLADGTTPSARRKAARQEVRLRDLADAARSNRDERTREHATMALALRPGSEVVDPLLAALKDASSQVREKAAVGLALRRDPRVLEALLAAAGDPDSQVREKVILALSLSGDPRALEAITRALDDSDPQVREKAASGLSLFSLGSLVGRTVTRQP